MTLRNWLGEIRRNAIAPAAAALALTTFGAAHAADGALSLSATYTVDLMGPVSGDGERSGRVLDNLDLVADLDLGKAVGWDGATLHGYLLSNQGDRPNDLAGTLQGVDNIEVDRQAFRLYELWLQAPIGEHATVLAGLYDLNSEFYANDAAGLLVGPPFGIGSELAATGPNGPSIFPSTALSVRLAIDYDRGYLHAAVLNASAGVPGDPDGVDTDFNHGALIIAEAGLTGNGKLAVGAWRYSDDQADIRDTLPGGDPVGRVAQGVYLLGERVLAGADGGRRTTAFFRLGASDGDTSPFKGGWQAGLLVEHVLAGRPDSTFSIGFQEGVLSSKMRANLRDGGVDASRAESGIEMTWSDRLGDRLTVQPDLQVIFDPGGDQGADTEVVAGVRLTFDLYAND